MAVPNIITAPELITDPAHIATEEVLDTLEAKIHWEYVKATQEMKEKLNDYIRRYLIKDEIWREAVENGTKTEDEYIEWRKNQILIGQRWENMLDVLARDAVNTDMIAMSIVKGYMPEVYAININYATYEIEHNGLLNSSFTLYDRQTVERLWRDNPKLLPDPAPDKGTAKKLKEHKDLIWNKNHIRSAVTQGVIQGEPIPQIATHLQSVTDKDRKAAVRNARTMMTSAQNAGRVDGNIRANLMGISTVMEWCATIDKRTRTSHRHLHGERRKQGEMWETEHGELSYPGDPEGNPADVYNCRCTLLTWVAGFEPSDKVTSSLKMGDMSYEEWLDAKPKSNPILLPEQKANAIKWSYIRQYREMRGG